MPTTDTAQPAAVHDASGRPIAPPQSPIARCPTCRMILQEGRCAHHGRQED